MLSKHNQEHWRAEQETMKIKIIKNEKPYQIRPKKIKYKAAQVTTK